MIRFFIMIIIIYFYSDSENRYCILKFYCISLRRTPVAPFQELTTLILLVFLFIRIAVNKLLFYRYEYHIIIINYYFIFLHIFRRYLTMNVSTSTCSHILCAACLFFEIV